MSNLKHKGENIATVRADWTRLDSVVRNARPLQIVCATDVELLSLSRNTQFGLYWQSLVRDELRNRGLLDGESNLNDYFTHGLEYAE